MYVSDNPLERLYRELIRIQRDVARDEQRTVKAQCRLFPSVMLLPELGLEFLRDSPEGEGVPADDL